jgi:type 1 glutamine amidotransferase
MDTVADKLGEHLDYEIHKAEQDQVDFDLSAFDLTDTEIFINQRLKDEQIKVLFGFTDEDGSRMQPTSGWYKESGKGRIFYYQAGHSVSDFENSNFIRVILNTLEWQPD